MKNERFIIKIKGNVESIWKTKKSAESYLVKLGYQKAFCSIGEVFLNGGVMTIIEKQTPKLNIRWDKT